MNIRQFAALCGVSASSVSRALNFSQKESGLSDELYRKIQERARKEGFKPNYYAKAMQARESNNIGFIAGGDSFKLISGALVDAVASLLTPRKKTLTIYTCGEQNQTEAEALDRMIYQGMDAIIFYPCFYARGTSNKEALLTCLQQYPKPPPVVALLGGVEIPQMFQVRVPEFEIGKRAALRQLGNGCRRFGILNTRFTTLRGEMVISGYYNTLVENGVSPYRIKWVNTGVPATEDELAALRGIDGLWASYLLNLPSCRYALTKVCNIEELHVDTFSSVETIEMLKWVQPATFSGRSKTYPFKTLFLSTFSLREMGICGAKIALDALEGKNSVPYSSYVDCNYISFEEQLASCVWV